MLKEEVAVLVRRSEIGLVYARAQEMSRLIESYPITRGVPMRFPGECFKSMLYEDCTCTIVVVMRRTCFDRVGYFDESLYCYGDWDMFLRVARYFSFAFVDRIFAMIRVHGESIGGSYSTLLNYERLRTRILDKAFAEPGLPPEILAVKQAAYRNIYLYSWHIWLGQRDWRRAFRALWLTIRFGGNPFVTVSRIMIFTLSRKVLSRFAWGRRLARWTARVRRRGVQSTPNR